MSILVVGASHRSAPVELLETLALDTGQASKLRAAALDTSYVREVVVLATCNRVEIYAQVERFHGSVEDLTGLLVERAGATAAADVVASLYVHYDAGAVAHLFSVATGLESMVVGEGQILGQVREALREAQDEGTVGPALNTLFQHGLRVGKRAHSETRIDVAGRSVVSVALDEAGEAIGDIARARVCIVGAGSVASLAVSTVRRAGARDIVVLSRTTQSARRLAGAVSDDGGSVRAAELSSLPAELAKADLVISCTGATGVVIDADLVAAALLLRTEPTPLTIVDLALPHDVALAVADLPGVALVGLPRIAAALAAGPVAEDVSAVERIVADEVVEFASARDQDRVAPTVVALRSMASGVIAAELDRLWSRLPELTERQRDEIARTLRREADKLLHEPTVRVKQFAGRVPDSSYAAALAELFALDPAAVDAVSGQRDDT
ncbi:MAG: glutamyl-tRNA reductase [Nocardioidaceae bacterium]